MKSLIFLLLMNSAFSLSVVSGFLYLTPISHAIGKLWSDITTFVKCTAFELIHPLFAVEDPDVNFFLYTLNNPEGCDLQPTQKALKKCKFNPKLRTKVLIHGWITKFPLGNMNFYIKDMFLQAGNFNVVVYNWTSYNRNTDTPIIDYPVSAARTILIGLKLSSWIWFLQQNTGVDPKSFHVFGHSLGSEVSAIAGKTTCVLGRITFLDPAAPIFRYIGLIKPAYTDAIHTEAIHSDASPSVLQGYGYMEPLAHVDFYPNGGNNQPKCFKGAHFLYMTGEVGTVQSSSTNISCNHYAALDYLITSFNKSCHFVGLVCANYESYLNGKCNNHNSNMCEMGIHAKINPNLPVHSKCYFQTSDHPPFCLH